MKVLIQIVQKAKVMVSNQLISNIHQGYVLFVGIEKEDTIETVQKMAQKVANLRINADESGKTNLSILDTKKEILYFNEINNIPGSLAFYLWEKTNLNFSDLIDQIIDIGIRHEYHKTELTLTYPANIFSRDELDQIKMSK